MFLSSHLPPHWRGHTLEQKKKKRTFHPPPPHHHHHHHHRHHLPVCLICSLLVMRLSSGTLPTTGCQVHSGFFQWKCELSSQISSTWKKRTPRTYWKEKGRTQSECVNLQRLLGDVGQSERDQKVCGFSCSWACLMSRLRLIWPCGPFQRRPLCTRPGGSAAPLITHLINIALLQLCCHLMDTLW